MLTGEVWQAVALSLNIEPDALPALDSRRLVDRPFDDCPTEFLRRLEIACNHIENGALQCTAQVPNTPYSTVSLSVFGTWAHARGWSLPDCLQGKSLPTAGNVRPPTGGRSAYEARVAAFQAEHGRNPPIQNTKQGVEGDREWATKNGVSREHLTEWRHELLGKQKGGRPKTENSAGNSAGNSPKE
jgi:hypothetical protein